jgi:hypothetical protein
MIPWADMLPDDPLNIPASPLDGGPTPSSGLERLVRPMKRRPVRGPGLPAREGVGAAEWGEFMAATEPSRGGE